MKKIFRILHRRKEGFTLLEVLVVVVILGLLAAVVIPNILGLMNEGREEAKRAEHHNIQIAVLAMMVEAKVTELDDIYPSVNTETQVSAVQCISGAYSLRDHLTGGKYPLMQAYDIDLKGSVTVTVD